MSEVKITCQSAPDDVRIYINKSLHLYFKKHDFISIQAWLTSRSSFHIELYFKNSDPIEVAYDSRTKWETILKLLNENI